VPQPSTTKKKYLDQYKIFISTNNNDFFSWEKKTNNNDDADARSEIAPSANKWYS
jgi:hypothetical protein